VELVPFIQAAQLIINCPHCTGLKFHSLLRKGLSLVPMLSQIIHFLSSRRVSKSIMHLKNVCVPNYSVSLLLRFASVFVC
jgi:hypothetical protein